MFVLDIIHSVWCAWTCAGLSLTIAVCSVFRTPLGLEGWILRLDTQALAHQSNIIKIQERMIATQQNLIETLTRQLMLEGITPWDAE